MPQKALAYTTEMSITDGSSDLIGFSTDSMYITATSTIPVPPPPKVVPVKYTSAAACSCVIFVKSITGYTGSVGAAKNWPINSNVPVVGGVIVFKGTIDNPYGHVAYIEGIEGNIIHIYQSNYDRCRINRDTVDLSDPGIKGFWQP